MTVDGREDLFHYTYLNANGYLNKFRGALNLPSLSLSLLAALLKTYKSRTRMAGFIVANKDGKQCLYNKEILNKILGMSNDGHFYLKPEQNPNLQMLHRFIDEWDMKAVEKENQPKYDISTYQNDDEDMEKVSDKLIQNDNYEEINEDTAKKMKIKELTVTGVFNLHGGNKNIKCIKNGVNFLIYVDKKQITPSILRLNKGSLISVVGKVIQQGPFSYMVINPKISPFGILDKNSSVGKDIQYKNVYADKEDEMNKKYEKYLTGGKYTLTFDDDCLEEFDAKKSLKNLIKRRDPAGIERKKKNIIITESQFNDLKKRLSESYFVEPEKVNIVKKFLDDNFVRGAIPSIGEDGYAKPIWVVGMKVPYSDKVKNMTATQAFYLLQDKFNHIYSDPQQRDKFLKKILVDWFYDRISKHGLLSKNNY